MIALVDLPSGKSRAYLTASVAAKLELNCVSPPPDTVEEVTGRVKANNLRKPPSR